MLLPTAVLAVGVLAACGGSSSAAAPAAPAATTTVAPAHQPSSAASTAGVMITIKNYGYTVSGATGPGEKVSVHNDDSVAHTVTADAGDKFDVTVAPSVTATFTAPAAAGSYPFHCTYHAEMHGALTVR
jgi:plastocyanin